MGLFLRWALVAVSLTGSALAVVTERNPSYEPSPRDEIREITALLREMEADYLAERAYWERRLEVLKHSR